MKKTAAAVALVMFGLGLLPVMPEAVAHRCPPGYKAFTTFVSRSNLQSFGCDKTSGEEG